VLTPSSEWLVTDLIAGIALRQSRKSETTGPIDGQTAISFWHRLSLAVLLRRQFSSRPEPDLAQQEQIAQQAATPPGSAPAGGTAILGPATAPLETTSLTREAALPVALIRSPPTG
jgi:hypothetical protein